MKAIGLTGGIGAGKSMAAAILAELGARVVDADRVGHEVYCPGTSGWKRVVEAFGEEILSPDGTIDRKRLGAVVFADPAQLDRLNRLVHPLIADALQERIRFERSRGLHTPIVVEAAVLIEANWVSLVDEVWVVVADRSVVLERLRAQRGLETEAVDRRMKAQLSDVDRRHWADVVIDNNGTPEQLREQLVAVWRERLGPL